MGYFTWTFANREIKKVGYGYASSCTLGYGYRGYIALPKDCSITGKNVVVNKDGYKFIREDYYDGYGMFGEHDVYDVIVDINKGYLKEFFDKSPAEKIQNNVYAKIAEAFENGRDEKYLEEVFGKTVYPKSPNLWGEWKRHLGIHISCYLTDNEKLHYPLKIVSSSNIIYEDLPASDSTQ